MPVSGSTMAAVLCRYSVRSLAMASRMKAIAIVNSSASKLSTVSHTLSNTWLVGEHRSERRAQQEQRAVREQHEDRRPARYQRLAASAPELVGGEPGIGGDDAGGEQHTQLEIAGEARQVRDHQPDHWTCDQIHWQRRPAVEHAGAGPSDGKAQEQHRVGKIDRDRL